jgi:hypothetical protein
MTRTSATSDRSTTGIPAKVRCRPDPDGVVVWVPVDEPERDEEATSGEPPDEAQVDQG